MKQIYEIPEGCTRISIEKIDNTIVTTFETETYIPKFGDICVWNESQTDCFSDLCKYPIIGIFGKHCEITGLSMSRRLCSDLGEGDMKFRPATNSEKQILFDALAKEGKQWNAETLQIEDMKVIPKADDCVRYEYKGEKYGYLVCKYTDNMNCHTKGDIYGCGSKRVKKGKADISLDSIFEILTPTQFQFELSYLGFVYNFENDTITVKKWIPKNGEVYFYFDSELSLKKHDYDVFDSDNERIKNGNCFKTKSECKAAIDKIKKVLNETN